MGKVFFNDWELWQKMTFVLGACILIVFCIAYGKLVWMNRYVERQEVIDEEKRARIQQLRQSGQFVESPNTHNIPFGVRAIQSGVQVDGIWISKTTTPVPHEIKSGRLSDNPEDDLPERELSGSPTITAEERTSSSVKATRLPTGRKQSPLGIRESGSSFIEHIDTYRPVATRSQNSYQPRKYSQLRHDSHGAYHDETLGQLSGNSSHEKMVHARRPRGSRRVYADAESSAADNERNSRTSSDSDATSLEVNMKQGPPPAGVESLPTKSYLDYFEVPTESPLDELSDPFASPMETHVQSQRPCKQGSRLSGLPNNSADRTEQNDPRTPFIPVNLHSNNVVRKVNSGFEILPAGTFTAPENSKGKGVDRGDRINDLNERQSQKLQKKQRYSSTVDRHVSSN